MRPPLREEGGRVACVGVPAAAPTLATDRRCSSNASQTLTKTVQVHSVLLETAASVGGNMQFFFSTRPPGKGGTLGPESDHGGWIGNRSVSGGVALRLSSII